VASAVGDAFDSTVGLIDSLLSWFNNLPRWIATWMLEGVKYFWVPLITMLASFIFK
jgi:hypothetical protein